MSDEYKCGNCGGVFVKVRTDEEAMAENLGKAVGIIVFVTLMVVTVCGCIWLMRAAFGWLA